MISATHSDMAAFLTRSARLSRTRADAETAQSELLSGRVANAASLGSASASRVQRITLDTARIDADQQTLGLLRANLQRTEVSLSHIAEQTGALSGDLLTTGFDQASSDRRAEGAKQAMNDVLTLMAQPESGTGGRQIDQTTLLESVSSAVRGAADPATALQSYFAPGGEFDTTFPADPPYAAQVLSDGRIPIQTLDIDAKGLRDAVAGFAAISLANGDEELSDLGSNLLLQAQDGITALRAQVGSRVDRVEDHQTANAHRMSALNVERNALDGIDPYEAATRLQAYQDRMDMALVLTRKMSDLSLVRYL